MVLKINLYLYDSVIFYTYGVSEMWIKFCRHPHKYDTEMIHVSKLLIKDKVKQWY